MAQRVYVLTAEIEKGQWQPVAVVTSEDTADQWYREGKNRDWVPLDLCPVVRLKA